MTDFSRLQSIIARTPAVDFLSSGEEDKFWWVKLAIDINHPLSWQVVQEYGHILNYLSVKDRLPTTFKPVSPPPYMNGGPEDFLSWVIECGDFGFTPDKAAEWLEGRLPRPVEDLSQWDQEI